MGGFSRVGLKKVIITPCFTGGGNGEVKEGACHVQQ